MLYHTLHSAFCLSCFLPVVDLIRKGKKMCKKSRLAAVMILGAWRSGRLLTCVNNLTILFRFPLNQPPVLLLRRNVTKTAGHYASSSSAGTLFSRFKNIHSDILWVPYYVPVQSIKCCFVVLQDLFLSYPASPEPQ